MNFTMGSFETDKYYPVEVFLSTIKKYDQLSDFATTFFKNMKHQIPYKSEFEMLMKSYLYGEQLKFVVEVLTFLSMDSVDFRQFNIIDYIICDEFYDSLVRHIYYLYEQRTLITTNSFQDFSLLVKFYESLISYLPDCDVLHNKFFALLQITFETMKMLGRCDLNLFERMKDLLKSCQEVVNSHEKKYFQYTNLNVFPTEVNLYEKHEFAPSIIRGGYKNSEQYLDIQFKLIRENFFQEIRDDFENIKKQRLGINRNSAYEVYKNVVPKVISSKKFKLCHVITFSPDDEIKLKQEDWISSKKFMTGSLLFFTKNDFTTFVIATLECNLCAFSEGKLIKIRVSVIGNPLQLTVGSSYDMLEPSSFFDPYNRSLKVLKSMNPYDFPFASDIISVSKRIHPSPLKPRLKSLLREENDLNKSQSIALNACLSQKFTLIQGPPGTGKSHLARVLINILGNDYRDNRPVLVICMRNRSLDNILEPLAKAGLKVMRFGRTDNEYLEDFTFYNYKQRDWNRGESKFNPIYSLLKNIISECTDELQLDKNPKNSDRVDKIIHRYNKAGEAMRLHLDYFDASTILSKKIQVIGATTNGAAKYNRMFSEIRPKTVIIEEAAEIMDGFLTACLPSSCDHLILVGDHLQLQPISSLPKSFNMNISLFERMIKNGKAYSILNVQHRMRPEIAELISPLIYEDLSNHPSVDDYPNVSGIAKNLFFFTHSVPEVFVPECVSFVNRFEGDMILSFASYLVKRGHQPEEITILAAYSAQQNYLMQNHRRYPLLSGIQILTIDNYQGDENNIILLSFVRSKGETIGFLSIPNRINVAFSRAKIGLFMFGNMDTLCNCSTIWPKVRKILQNKKNIGTRLPLGCRIHNSITSVSNPQQINKIPHRACNKICGMKKECGHVCSLPCHGNLKLHSSEPCKQPCLRKPCQFHNCKKKCFEDCGTCKELRAFVLKCGHSVNLHCSTNPDEISCIRSCEQKVLQPATQSAPGSKIEKQNFQLKCGHQVSLPHSTDISTYKCVQKCQRKCCPDHDCEKLCYEQCDPCSFEVLRDQLVSDQSTVRNGSTDVGNYMLQKEKKKPSDTVDIRLKPCGHMCICKGICTGICEEVCNKKLTFICGHVKSITCKEDPKSIVCGALCGKSSSCGIKNHLCIRYCHYPAPCPPCEIAVSGIYPSCGHGYSIKCVSRLRPLPKCTASYFLICKKCRELFKTSCSYYEEASKKKICNNCSININKTNCSLS